MTEAHPEIIIVKRHSAHEEEHHGGAWKIAFAGSSTFTGLKYRAISVLVFLSVALMIQSTRKNAIIAVMKSAKAIFHAPP